MLMREIIEEILMRVNQDEEEQEMEMRTVSKESGNMWNGNSDEVSKE
jgi:hypothetical protein